jgi:hypothetical protein
MEKYISYCLYGNNPKYYVGAKKNLEINNKLLPDWKSIIYYDSKEVDKNFILELQNLGCITKDINLLEITKSVNYQMFWRYFIFEDSKISIVRDLDSRLSDREIKYINLWLESNSNYFIIRDHPWQSEVPGGLFGIKNPNNFWGFFKNFVKNRRLGWGIDQEMLKTYMDTINKNNVSYFSFENKSTYIPRDNKNFFIGIQLDENDEVLAPNSTLALEYLKNLNL